MNRKKIENRWKRHHEKQKLQKQIEKEINEKSVDFTFKFETDQIKKINQ